MYTITPAEVREQQQRLGSVALLDVRGAAEFAAIHADGAENIPLHELTPDRVAHLSRHDPVYVICKSGARSQMGIRVLHGLGFTQLYNVAGGTDGWEAAGLPVRSAHAIYR
jgi:rhodanese-related sulfurtransferase